MLLNAKVEVESYDYDYECETVDVVSENSGSDQEGRIHLRTELQFVSSDGLGLKAKGVSNYIYNSNLLNG